MITIEYTKTGTAWSDFDYPVFVKWVKDAITQKRGVTFKISTSVPVYAIRLAVVTGEISAHDVQFLYNGTVLKMLSNGLIPNVPEGFADRFSQLDEAYLDAYAKRWEEGSPNGN